ncbi:MAG: UDP-glucose/GDP-mannose dehydrogenase family protein [Methanomassiliicoccales archaeon]|nr:MAG: UDP-glucose/GDP-mannose dehydrogenase family protein [Methanomassiliicoccales archaeon]
MKDIKITMIGMGYVGLVTGAAFAKHGFDTTCTTRTPEKAENLNKGITPFYEPGLDELVKEGVDSGLFHGSTDNKSCVKKGDITFICVGTPSLPDGGIDLSHVKKTACDIGEALADLDRYHVVVAKSTIIPSTTDSLILPLLEEKSKKKVGKDFGLCMNPEFLREGAALHDSLYPDRIVVGGYDQRSIDTVMNVYSGFDCPKFECDLRTAEMIKYAANCLLATKITFANELANICEFFGVDVYEMMKGVGLDFRINPAFLNAGVGFGGSCFPKDVNAITAVAKSKGYQPRIMNAILEVNETQPLRIIELAENKVQGVKNKRIALLGLSFKPDTDDVRFTRALPIAEALIEKGAEVVAYDPKAIDNFKELTDKPITYAASAKDALRDADICVIQSDWDEFKALKPQDFKELMKTPIIIDGRRTYDPMQMIQEGITYLGIGWKNP